MLNKLKMNHKLAAILGNGNLKLSLTFLNRFKLGRNRSLLRK